MYDLRCAEIMYSNNVFRNVKFDFFYECVVKTDACWEIRADELVTDQVRSVKADVDVWSQVCRNNVQ